MSPWIDISLPLKTGMVHWPGDLTPRLERAADMNRGDIYNARELHMSAHTGTHMDAPLHFLNDGPGIDMMPFEATVGRARIFEYADPAQVTTEVQPHRHLVQGQYCQVQPRYSHG